MIYQIANDRPDWVKAISHNFNNEELDLIELSACMDSSLPIKIRDMVIVPDMIGSPIIIPFHIKQTINNFIETNAKNNL